VSDAPKDTETTGRKAEQIAAAAAAFERLYSHWLAARESARPGPSVVHNGRPTGSNERGRPGAARHALDLAVDGLAEMGSAGLHPTVADNGTVVALACIKADLMRFGIADGPE
jgi:hypothetical protein